MIGTPRRSQRQQQAGPLVSTQAFFSCVRKIVPRMQNAPLHACTGILQRLHGLPHGVRRLFRRTAQEEEHRRSSRCDHSYCEHTEEEDKAAA